MNKIVTAIYFISLLFIWLLNYINLSKIFSYYALNTLILSSFYEACTNHSSIS